MSSSPDKVSVISRPGRYFYPRLIRSGLSIDGNKSLLTRIFIGGRPVSLASWAKIRSQSVAFAAAPIKIDGMAINIQAKPAQTDWIRALLALLAERTRWKYACHGRPPKINIMKLSTHRGASEIALNLICLSNGPSGEMISRSSGPTRLISDGTNIFTGILFQN